MKKKVVIGISGGVDSAVAAYLLKKQGYEVIGVFMQNWDPYINNESKDSSKSKLNTCEAEYDFEQASLVCKKLGIPIHRVNFIKEYWTMVFEPFLSKYKKGLTPNPDVLCNKYIKFGTFHDYCVKNFDCDFVATGHYAKVNYDKEQDVYELLEAYDDEKDQTYFLCFLNQDQLSKSLFPLSDLTKREVREIANKLELPNWNRKDSTGICFIGERNFRDFLRNYIKNKEGPIIDIDTDETVGKHEGIHLYTIGQRKGLNLGGHESKYFVCRKDPKTNTIFVSNVKNKNKHLNSNQVTSKNFNWISYIPNNNNVELRFRHTKNKIIGKFNIFPNESVAFCYEDAMAVTTGQYVVAYQNGICLGGGEINKVILNNQHHLKI
ncbi:MAG: tRNA 2-thiouridine(34) synthase MnmA [Malacoplasma sp.]|nr:tRNA 2-thiouridine(34) synthase MnmA [Malacoplasma sp.]